MTAPSNPAVTENSMVEYVQKSRREANGWRGSRATADDLEGEIADVLICLDKLAAHYNIDLASVTTRKFNQTSEKVGLPQRLAFSQKDRP